MNVRASLLVSSILVPTLAACGARSGPCVRISNELGIAPRGDAQFLADCEKALAGTPDPTTAAGGIERIASQYYPPDSFLAEIDGPIIKWILDGH